MKDWYLGLESRERVFVLIGGVLAAVFLFWGLVINPLYGASAATASRIESKQNTLAFLRGAAAELAAAGHAPAAQPDLAGQSLVVIVDRSARAAGLGTALTRNQPVGEDAISVRMENAAFDNLARWLDAINASSGLAIESASFDRTPEDGRVNASLVLRLGLQ
jgi:general secretion pathway protein M